MTTLFEDTRFLDHETGNHPEKPERLKAIRQELVQTGLLARCTQGKPRAATLEELARIHDRQYIRQLQKYVDDGGGWIEPSTVVCQKSFDVAVLAAGTALSAVDTVMTGADQQAVCLIRPPGHHALVDSAMGFCLFNNIALAADHAVKTHQAERVLVIDWDVHHGNGTQDIFYRRSDVWFYSIHRSPFYPWTGKADETGTGQGLGTKFNLPIEFGTTRRAYLAQFENELNQIVKRCRPQLILVSAGFDAHALDPVGSLGLETEDFETITRLVMQVAQAECQGKLVSCLEGGYHVQRLAESVALHVKTLLG